MWRSRPTDLVGVCHVGSKFCSGSPVPTESNIDPAMNMNIKLLKLERLQGGWVSRVGISSGLGGLTLLICPPRLPPSSAPSSALVYPPCLPPSLIPNMQNGKSSKSSPLEVATLVTTAVLTFPILTLAYLLHWLTGVPWATEEIDRLGELRLFLDKMDQYLRGANIVLSPPALEATNLLEFWRKRCVSHCGPPPQSRPAASCG